MIVAMSVGEVVTLVVGGLAIAAGIGGVATALAGRGIRQERIEHLEGLVDELREEATALQTRCSRLEAQVEVLTDGMANRIGARVADVVLARLAANGR